MKKQIIKTVVAIISIFLLSGVYRWGTYILSTSYASLAASQADGDSTYYQAAKFADSLKGLIDLVYFIALVLLIIWLISGWVKYVIAKGDKAKAETQEK